MHHQNPQQAIELYKNHSIADISKILKASTNSIHRILKKAGVVRNVQEGLKIARQNGKIYKHKPIDDLLSNKDRLLNEYSKYSLTELGTQYKCDRKRIAAALQRFDIPIHNWGVKSHKAQTEKREAALPPLLLDKNWLFNAYTTGAKSINDISESLGCSTTAVRNRLKKFNIPIRPPVRFSNIKPKTSRGRIVIYKPLKSPQNEITFRSLLECGYAAHLDSSPSITSWEYEATKLAYTDGFTGKRRIYICDFKILYSDGHVENIEVKPLRLQTYEDKYLYAQNLITNWRFCTHEEIITSYNMLPVVADKIEFPLKFSTKLKKFIIYSKSDEIILPDGYRKLRTSHVYSIYFAHKIINDRLAIKLSDIRKTTPPPNKRKPLSGISLGLDQILQMIKSDISLKQIAVHYKVDPRTITDFLNNRSYVIKWGTNSLKHNIIRHLTKQIWPENNLPDKPRTLRVIYPWDNHKWLHEYYIVRKLSTRTIGRLIGKSGRLVSKKLKYHNIQCRSSVPNRSHYPSH